MKLIKEYINGKQKQETGELLVREFIKFFEFELYDEIKPEIDTILFTNGLESFKFLLTRERLMTIVDEFLRKKPISLELFENLVSIDDVMCDYLEKQNVLYSFNKENGDYVLKFKKSKYWNDLIYDQVINHALFEKTNELQRTEISEERRREFNVIFTKYLEEKQPEFLSGGNSVIDMNLFDLIEELEPFTAILKIHSYIFKYEVLSEQLSNYAIDNNWRFREYREDGQHNFILMK